MRTITKTLSVLACIVALPAFSAADDVLPTAGDEIEKFRSAGDWVIYRNVTRGHCFASKAGDIGLIQMGFTKDEGAAYLGAFLQDWPVEEGTRPIHVVVNDNVYKGDVSAVTQASNGWSGGYILVNNKDFVRDVEKADELVAFPDSPNTFILDMSDSANTIFEIRKCTDEMRES
jgi:hypothetical protein